MPDVTVSYGTPRDFNELFGTFIHVWNIDSPPNFHRLCVWLIHHFLACQNAKCVCRLEGSLFEMFYIFIKFSQIVCKCRTVNWIFAIIFGFVNFLVKSPFALMKIDLHKRHLVITADKWQTVNHVVINLREIWWNGTANLVSQSIFQMK